MLPLMLIASLVFTGCADLIVRDTDSSAEVTGKVAARTVLFPLTIGFSELVMSDVKARDACDRMGGWYFWGDCRDPKARETAIRLAPYLIPPMTMQPYYAPVQPIGGSPSNSSIKTCQTRQFGNGMGTVTCY